VENPVCAESSESSTTPVPVCGDFAKTHRQHLSPFVLSLSKQERTLNGLSMPEQTPEQSFPSLKKPENNQNIPESLP
jgi:hypothetical protein